MTVGPSTSTAVTSTGHAFSDTSWLDQHFQSARAEYEDGLRWVGIQRGWTILDAGCGGGGFVQLISEQVGSVGAVYALDLAPENVAQVEALAAKGSFPSPVHGKVGSVLSLPFADATFDCVWSANVAQYLTELEFERSIAECKRVLKPGGIVAIKDQDASIFQIIPIDADVLSRLWQARRVAAYDGVPGPWTGTLGPWSAASIPKRLRKSGLTVIRRKSWLVERWAPVESSTRSLVEDALKRWAKFADESNLPEADKQVWRAVGATPENVLNDPDFCFREAFVVAIGQVPKVE